MISITPHTGEIDFGVFSGMKKEISYIHSPLADMDSIRRIAAVFICCGTLGLLTGCVTTTTTRRVSLPSNFNVTSEIAMTSTNIPMSKAAVAANDIKAEPLTSD